MQVNALAGRTSATLREIIEAYKGVYCRTIGFEYMHIQDRAKCQWLRSQIEVPQVGPLARMPPGP